MTIVTDINTGIYTITNLTNGRVYIGCTTNDFGKRWDQHRRQLAKGKHANGALQQDWNAFGMEAFAFAIVERVKSKVDVWEHEIMWIEAASTPLYNVKSTVQARMPWSRKRRPLTTMPELLTVDEVTKALKVSEQTVWRYIKSGKLLAAKVGGQWRVKPESVTALTEPTRREEPREAEA